MDKLSNSDHLLNILAMGVPANIKVELDFSINREVVQEIEDSGSAPAPANGTWVSKKTFGQLQAKFEQMKYDYNKLEDYNKTLQKQLKDLNRLDEEVMRGRGVRLKPEIVWRVRRLFKIGRTDTWIANTLNISNTSVNRIRSGQSYKHVPEEPAREKPVVVHAGFGEVK